MRKYFSFILVIVTLLFLVACDKNNNGITGNVEIISQELNGNTYSYVLNIKETVSEENELLEIGYTAASQIVEVLSEDIGVNKRVLKLTLQSNKITKLILTYTINDNLDKPGLKLLSTEFN